MLSPKCTTFSRSIPTLTTLALLVSLALSSCGIGKGGNYGERVANCLVSAKHPDSLFTMPLDSLPGALEIDSTMHYRVRNGMEHNVDSIPAPLILGQMDCLFGNWYDIPSCALVTNNRNLVTTDLANEIQGSPIAHYVQNLGIDKNGDTIFGQTAHGGREITRNTNAYINLILEKNRLIEELTIFYARIHSGLIPTQYINNSQQLQKSLQQQGFLLDGYGERIKIIEEGKNGEQRQQFEIASLEHIPNNLKQDILRKLYKEFETQRDELKRKTQGMIEKYLAHFNACPYTYNEEIEVDNLQAFQDRLYELERETPVETSDETETPQNCFSIQGDNLVSSCEEVSGNVIIHSINGSFIKEQIISSNRMNLRDLLSNQASGMYIVTITFDNNLETLQYVKP